MILKVFIAQEMGKNVVKFSIGLQTFTLDFEGTDVELEHHAEMLLHALRNLTHIEDDKWVEANDNYKQYTGTVKMIARLKNN